MRARLLAAALLVVAAGCGETLVDHNAPNLYAPPPDQITTIIQGACNTVDACGPTCSPCPSPDPGAVTTGFASAVRACYGTEPSTFCGYECTGGLLKCATGCCQAASVAAAQASTCAITTSGGLFCWGDNANGQLAAGAAVESIPVKLHDANVTAVAVGEGFTCAVVSGAVSCRGSFRSLGAVPSPAIASVVQLAAGADHVCARTAAGAVECWGSNTLGQRGGPGTGNPAVATPISSGATSISAGTDHTCAVVGSGAAAAVKCWGSRAAGQLGDASATGFSSSAVAVSVVNTSASGIGVVAGGTELSCAAPSVGARVGGSSGIWDALQCWGTGLGSLVAASPQTTPAIPMKDVNTSAVRFQVDRIGVGRAHVCVQRNDAASSVACLAADNTWGQLGSVTVTPPEALDVPGTLAARAFATGADHACAVLSSGGVECWGRNTSGQLGDGTTVTPGVGGDARVIGTPVLVKGR
jgi:alpha-tubulin suppressor-like RCC1 family protein